MRARPVCISISPCNRSRNCFECTCLSRSVVREMHRLAHVGRKGGVMPQAWHKWGNRAQKHKLCILMAHKAVCKCRGQQLFAFASG